MRAGLEDLLAAHDGLFSEVRGKGLIQGLVTSAPEIAGAIGAAAFERGLLLETAGPQGEVVKLLPPLVVAEVEIERALGILSESVDAVLVDVSEELLVAGEVTK